MSLFRYPQTYYQVTGDYVNSEWTEAKSGPFTFYGTIQPDTGKDEFPKETGQDDTGRVVVISTTQLRVGEEGQTTTGDRVLYVGRWYRLSQELPYQNRLIPHFSYKAVLDKEFAP